MAEPLRAVPAHSSADPGILLAQAQEDLVVGDELVRFRYYTRVVHWGVALTFFLCLFTGLPIWTPIFGWLASLFGGLQVCRWLHPWSGVAFAVFALLQFVHWAGEMKMTPADKRFTRQLPRLPALGDARRGDRQVQRRPEAAVLAQQPGLAGAARHRGGALVAGLLLGPRCARSRGSSTT